MTVPGLLKYVTLEVRVHRFRSSGVGSGVGLEFVVRAIRRWRYRHVKVHSNGEAMCWGSSTVVVGEHRKCEVK